MDYMSQEVHQRPESRNLPAQTYNKRSHHLTIASSLSLQLHSTGSWAHITGSYWPFKIFSTARSWWLIPVILAIQEAEIRRIMIGTQPGQTVLERSYLEKTQHKKGLVECSECRPWVQTPVPSINQ
jgi:hypothetical protein